MAAGLLEAGHCPFPVSGHFACGSAACPGSRRGFLLRSLGSASHASRALYYVSHNTPTQATPHARHYSQLVARLRQGWAGISCSPFNLQLHASQCHMSARNGQQWPRLRSLPPLQPHAWPEPHSRPEQEQGWILPGNTPRLALPWPDRDMLSPLAIRLAPCLETAEHLLIAETQGPSYPGVPRACGESRGGPLVSRGCPLDPARPNVIIRKATQSWIAPRARPRIRCL